MTQMALDRSYDTYLHRLWWSRSALQQSGCSAAAAGGCTSLGSVWHPASFHAVSLPQPKQPSPEARSCLINFSYHSSSCSPTTSQGWLPLQCCTSSVMSAQGTTNLQFYCSGKLKQEEAWLLLAWSLHRAWNFECCAMPL